MSGHRRISYYSAAGPRERGVSYHYKLMSVFLLYFLLPLRSLAAENPATAVSDNLKRIDAAVGADFYEECTSGPLKCYCEWNIELEYAEPGVDPYVVHLSNKATDSLRNFANIEIANNGSLLIRQLASGNTGRYSKSLRCDNLTEQSTAWHLNVINEVVRLRHARLNRAFAGNSLLLHCKTADSNSSGSVGAVSWTKDGKPMAQTNEIDESISTSVFSINYNDDQLGTRRDQSPLPKFVFGLNGGLLVRNLTKADEGVYACRGQGEKAYDFVPVRLVKSSSLSLDYRVVSDNLVLITRPKPTGSYNAPLHGQRFYLGSLRWKDGRVDGLVEDTDPNSTPFFLGDESVTAASLSAARFELLKRRGRGDAADWRPVAEDYARETLSNLGSSQRNLNLLHLALRERGKRYEVDVRAAANVSLADCPRCACSLEQSYELTVYSGALTKDFLPYLDMVATYASQPVVVRVLTTLHDEKECAQIVATMRNFSSSSDKSTLVPAASSLPVSATTTPVPATTTVAATGSGSGSGFMVDNFESMNLNQMLIAIMVGCVLVLISVAAFVAICLVRTRRKLEFTANRNNIVVGNGALDIHLLQCDQLEREMHLQLQSQNQKRASRACYVPITPDALILVDSKEKIGVEQASILANQADAVCCDVNSSMKNEGSDHDQAASSSSSAVTTNTSCLCSANASVDSRQSPVAAFSSASYS